LFIFLVGVDFETFAGEFSTIGTFDRERFYSIFTFLGETQFSKV